MKIDKNIQAFFSLLRAGLWEHTDANLNLNDKVDWEKMYLLAEEQSVVGLVLAGIERYKNLNDNARSASPLGLSKNFNFDDNANHANQLIDNEGDSQLGLRSTLRLELPPQELLLQWIGEVQFIEQQNKALNEYVAKLIEKLRKEDVYAILVKGQGIAQCYEKPLWRASGDVDLLLSEQNYEKAKTVLLPLAVDVEREYKSFKHQGMTMPGDFVVELHGTMHSRLSKRIDKGVDEAQRDVFFGGNVRSWQNGNTSVFLPSPNNDVIFVFTHILHHFYIEGIGLRQICDWCRLLYRYRSELDLRLLESRIKQMGLMSEWKAFAAFVVEYLGMPVEAMPLYDVRCQKDDVRWKKKAEHILQFVIESGNFGHNREAASGKFSSAWYKMKDFAKHARIFPMDSIKFFFHFLRDGLVLATSK